MIVCINTGKMASCEAITQTIIFKHLSVQYYSETLVEMLSKLARATLALTLASFCAVQAQYVTQIPAAEASALAQIVEVFC